MNYDIILCGVGGQGVLSVAAIIAKGAMLDGLNVRQSEVHGMAQRGGAVQAHLRLADSEIYSDLIAKGSAQMILSMEPLEGLRYLGYLSLDGILITASEPLKNIPDYPGEEELYAVLHSLPSCRIIEAERLAREAGNPRATNMVIVGAASKLLPVRKESLESAIADLFSAKGAEITARNIRAFELGRESQR